tara:strand:- start:364 stop:630 length:267 start_codon:yes stop_codon:yes gene_type:complete
MENLNVNQRTKLDTLLNKTSYDINEAKAIVELYILVRKGKLISINLEKGTEGYAAVMKGFIMHSQVERLTSCQQDALDWFGLNYRKND